MTCLCDLLFMQVYSCYIYLHVIRLCWNWHTCIPYALRHPRTIGVSAWYKSREDGSEGSLKHESSEGSPQTKNINRRSGPIDIHRRVVHKQLIYQSSERPN